MEVDPARARLIIVCGLPGSGKTTRAREREAVLRGVRFCPDEWMAALGLDLRDEASRGRIEALQWEMCQRLLPLGLPVIVEWGTWGRSERDALRLGARSLGAAVELHYLTAPTDILFDRIRRRGREDPPMERGELEQAAQTFQAPTTEEIALFDAYVSAG